MTSAPPPAASALALRAIASLKACARVLSPCLAQVVDASSHPRNPVNAIADLLVGKLPNAKPTSSAALGYSSASILLTLADRK